MKLAIKDLRHDWQASACFIAALVGVLAPLLIILALKNGVIGTMIDRLVEDPSNRQLIAIGSNRHDVAFFSSVAAMNEVEFVVPSTRSINASADALQNVAKRRLERSVPLIPTAPGDPLLGAVEVKPGHIYVSTALATNLDFALGDEIDMFIGREIDGRQETASRSLSVAGVLPIERYAKPAAFLALEDLIAVERFRDDVTVTPENWQKPRERPSVFASFRLYVRDLNDLTRVQSMLEDRGVQTRPRAENAEVLLAFRDNLNILYFVIAIVAIIGFWASMSANLRGMVERQRISFSLLNLLGMARHARFLIPFLQSQILIVAGFLATLLIVLPAILVINVLFSNSAGELVASLDYINIAATLLLGIVTGLTASAWAVMAIGGIHTEEVLRHA
jgi:putative ABC transport system permease protein